MMGFFFLHTSSQSSLHLPAPPLWLKLPLVSSRPPEGRQKEPALLCAHRKRVPVVLTRERGGGASSGGRSPLPHGGSWVLPCGERRFWPALPSSEGEGFSSPPAGTHGRLLAASSKGRVGIPARFWLVLGLQFIFSRSFVIFFMSKTLRVYLKLQDFIFILPYTLIDLTLLFLSSHALSFVCFSYSEIHAG